MPRKQQLTRSKRLGSFKARRFHPVFVSRELHGSGFCGHQHSSNEQACACATNNARRHAQTWATYEVNEYGSEKLRSIARYEWTAQGTVVHYE